MSLDPAAILERIKAEAARRLLAAALALQAAHRGDLSAGNPSPHDNPAPKGQFPRLRTGGLRAGVAIEPATVAGVVARGGVAVGYRPSAAHGIFLGGKGWKWLIDTYRREQPRLRVILAGGGTHAAV